MGPLFTHVAWVTYSKDRYETIGDEGPLQKLLPHVAWVAHSVRFLTTCAWKISISSLPMTSGYFCVPPFRLIPPPSLNCIRSLQNKPVKHQHHLSWISVVPKVNFNCQLQDSQNVVLNVLSSSQYSLGEHQDSLLLLTWFWWSSKLCLRIMNYVSLFK